MLGKRFKRRWVRLKRLKEPGDTTGVFAELSYFKTVRFFPFPLYA